MSNTRPCITFSSSSDEFTIAWEQGKEDKVRSLVKGKLDDGFTFFLTKNVPVEATGKTFSNDFFVVNRLAKRPEFTISQKLTNVSDIIKHQTVAFGGCK